MNRCLYCYNVLPETEKDFHKRCSLNFFGTTTPPALDYNYEEMQDLAKEIVTRSIAITGVQPKLSLTIEKYPGDSKASRFTIVGLWGAYILKPPAETFPFLPENEDITMHLAAFFGIKTADHSLIRLKSGELAYITKRFDRVKNEKLALEDMCQLTETMTADKYKGSMEKVGKHIAKFSTRRGFDLAVFFETTLFCYLTGNADMHLKNFSLLTTERNDIVLSPAYDLLCTKMAMPDDKDEMALTINAKKRKLRRSDFDSLANNLNIPERALQRIYKRFADKLNAANMWIDTSFLPDELKSEYKQILDNNRKKIDLV